MGDPRIDSLHDPYEEQLSAARYKAERDAAVQELQGLRKGADYLEDMYHEAFAELLGETAKAKRLGRLVWRLQNRLARSHRREKALRKGMREWREKAIGGPVRTVSAYDLMSDGEREVLRIWPRFEETGEPVLFGDSFLDHHGDVRSVLSFEMWQEGGFTLHTGQGTADWHSAGERVKRPAAIAADGEPLEVGQKVWGVEDGKEFEVVNVNGELPLLKYGETAYTATEPEHLTHQRPVLDADGVEIREGETVWSTVGEFDGKRTVKSVHVDDYKLPYALFEDGRDPWSCMCCYLTHRAPVIAADGRPLREGEHVYHVETGAELVVKGLPKPGEYQAVVVFALPTSPASHLTSFDPDQLTHERPVEDTWERLEEDTGKTTCEYFDQSHGCGECPHYPSMCSIDKARDLVRRCKALAERGER